MSKPAKSVNSVKQPLKSALAMGDDPLYVLPADGAGGRLSLDHVSLVRARR